MTFDEKLQFFAGDLDAIDHITGVSRLHVPDINMGDGPNGVANTVDGTATSFPSNMAAGDTFDPTVVRKYAQAMAEEFKAKGKNMILGPGVNFNRVAQCGRTDEYITGDDPVLGAELVKAFVVGARDEHVMVTVKHFANNNQETNRNDWSANPDTRTQMEIYLKPFLAAVHAGAASLMCAYNKVQGVHACKNKELLQAAKREGDSIFIVSDWGAVYPDAGNGGIVDYIDAGLDVEMGTHDTPGCDGHASPDAHDYCNKGDYMLKDRMRDLVRQGRVSKRRVNETVSRVLGALKSAGLLDPVAQAEFPTYTYKDLHTKLDGPLMRKDVRTQHSRAVAHEVAAKAMVLLQNTGALLPLKTTEKLELYGCGDEVHFRAEAGSAAGTKPFVPSNPCQPDDITACMYPNDAVVAAGASARTFRLDHANAGPRDPDATAVVCITAASKNSEGRDRQNLDLLGGKIPWWRFKRSVVWVVSPGPVLIPFKSKVNSILLSSLPGEMGGAAFADIIFGKVSPTGHLSMTLPNSMDETSVRVNGGSDDYAEGVEVGYRWYQANGKSPNFAFGWGLSYATRLLVTNASLKSPAGTARPHVAITLEWPADGQTYNGPVGQVVQIYVQHRQPHARNFQQLISFAKIESVAPGRTPTIDVAFDVPRTWGSAPGDRHGFDAGWDLVTKYTLFVSLYGVEDTRAIFTVDASDGAFKVLPEHDFTSSPLYFDQGAVVEARGRARSGSDHNEPLFLI
jgi:beta-glucosidase